MRNSRHDEAGREAEQTARITCQFRDRNNMVYELDCRGRQLSFTMSGAPREGGLWQAGASVRHSEASPALSGSGASRGDALGAVAEEWQRRGEPAGYPILDWAAIRAALVAVRAV
ncbi:MAG: hypothetical protein L6Q84_18190 [Polyangiaceae bacterium]|nr:hypothetical protein [Polyangiaceae bacterium]